MIIRVLVFCGLKSRAPRVRMLGDLPPWEVIYWNEPKEPVAFHVDAKICTNNFYFSFSPEGWHPFVATLTQHLARPGLTFRESVLHEYYAKFQPVTLADVLFEWSAEESSIPAGALRQLPALTQFQPWGLNRRRPTRGERGLDLSHGCQDWGPVSEQKGDLEFSRLVTVCRSIRERGYEPDRFDGDIRGYFLRYHDEYRFIVREGKHRMAALAALGYRKVRVRFQPNIPGMIDIRDAADWPQVRNGFIDQGTAERIFERFFRESGHQKAKNIGIGAPTVDVNGAPRSARLPVNG